MRRQSFCLGFRQSSYFKHKIIPKNTSQCHHKNNETNSCSEQAVRAYSIFLSAPHRIVTNRLSL
jgi:hypothetical protein